MMSFFEVNRGIVSFDCCQIFLGMPVDAAKVADDAEPTADVAEARMTTSTPKGRNEKS